MLIELGCFGTSCLLTCEIQLLLNSSSTRDFHLREAEFCERVEIINVVMYYQFMNKSDKCTLILQVMRHFNKSADLDIYDVNVLRFRY